MLLMSEVMGLRCGILLGRAAEVTTAALKGVRETYLADGKPVEAIDQALQLLASAPPARLPAGAGAAAGGNGSLPVGVQLTPAGAAAGAGAASLSGAGVAAAEHGSASAAQPALESGATVAGEGGRSPQGADDSASGAEGGCPEKEPGSAASGSGHGGGHLIPKRVANPDTADADADDLDDGLIDALGVALETDEPASEETVGSSEGQAAAPPPGQQLQLVGVLAGEAAAEAKKAAPAPAIVIEPKKRGRSGGEAAPKAGPRAKKQ